MTPIEAIADPTSDFRTDHYLRINARRLEHLVTLGLPLRGRRVLELGAGIGDLTPFFLDRGCDVTAVEGRAASAAILERRFEGERVRVVCADLNSPPTNLGSFDVVFAYGVLYHLSDPGGALRWMADCCDDLLLLSTCVSEDSTDSVHAVSEDAANASQALDGLGCRPDRTWIMERMRALLPHAYATVTQPDHEEFPLRWDRPATSQTGLQRAVFIGSRSPLSDRTRFSERLSSEQTRA